MPEITSLCCTLYICNKISIRKSLLDVSHIQLFWFPFSVSSKQNINITEVFHIKYPVQFFHFCHPKAFKYSLQVFLVGFSSFLLITDWRNLTILVYERAKTKALCYFPNCSDYTKKLKKFFYTLWGMELAKKFRNDININININYAQVSRLIMCFSHSTCSLTSWRML